MMVSILVLPVREVRSSGCRKEALKPHSVLWEPSEPYTLQLGKEFVP